MISQQTIFLSYHHDDEKYIQPIISAYGSNYVKAISSQNDPFPDINNASTETVIQNIRDKYLKGANVMVVLISNTTWRRKYVDWEIYFALRDTRSKPRLGLMGILLPNYSAKRINVHTIPPRLADNLANGYARLYRWSSDKKSLIQWTYEASVHAERILPDNSREMYRNNRSSDQIEWSE